MPQQVFDALALPLEEYASDPSVKFQARRETENALRNVLGYRLYRDLKRGWRITAPNLEQVGLLDVQYLSLVDVCADEDTWQGTHLALATATPTMRRDVARTLLDFMRRELAIKVNYLQQDFQERLQQQSDQRLSASSPWALDENESFRMEYATVLYPRSRRPDDERSNVYLSARSGFGQYLRRPATFPQHLTLADAGQIITGLLEGLQVAGLVEVVAPAARDRDVPGYQVPASALVWSAGTGTRPYRDPIRIPSASEQAAHANAFFDGMYAHLYGLSREDFEYILTTFPVLKKNEERQYGEYRAARLALALVMAGVSSAVR